MNTRYLWAAAGTGILLGIVTTLGVGGESRELWWWLLVAAMWGFLAHRMLERDLFRHVVLGGAIAGFLAADVNVLFWDTFVANHPTVQQLIAEQGGRVPRLIFLLNGVLKGSIFGLMVGAPLAWFRLRQAPGPVPLESDDSEE